MFFFGGDGLLDRETRYRGSRFGVDYTLERKCSRRVSVVAFFSVVARLLQMGGRSGYKDCLCESGCADGGQLS